jgi:hypothetical protein
MACSIRGYSGEVVLSSAGRAYPTDAQAEIAKATESALRDFCFIVVFFIVAVQVLDSFSSSILLLLCFALQAPRCTYLLNRPFHHVCAALSRLQLQHIDPRTFSNRIP